MLGQAGTRWRRVASLTTLLALLATVLSSIATTPLVSAATVEASWQPQGPRPTRFGQVENIPGQNPVSGAVHDVQPHPTDPDVLWIATVNGGIWRTNNATSANPTWVNQTDHLRTQSMGAIELDPTIGTGLVLVAGFGRFSSNNREGGSLEGLIRTTDGGLNWTPIGGDTLDGQTVSGIAARGDTIVATANAVTGTGGVWRSTDTGATFTRISGDGTSGLPNASVFDLVGDPVNRQVLYASVASNGLYRSTDTGATWTRIADTTFGGAAITGITGSTTNLEMTVHRQGATPVVYAGVINNGRLADLMRTQDTSYDQVPTWTTMDLPSTNEGGTIWGLQPREKPGSQGAIHFSMLADRADASVVYLGGDRQPNPFPNSLGAEDFSGRLFRCDADLAAGSQCTSLTHNGTASNSAPHADSRDMEFDANGDIIEGDDGGIYRRTSPGNTAGDWFSLNGNLQIAEFHSCAWDNVADITICGSQDNGTPEQISTGSTTWRAVTKADGGVPAVARINATSSVRYSSIQNLGNFSRRICDADNNCDSGTSLATPPNVDFYQPIAANAVDSNRLVVPTTRVWESTNRGDSFTDSGALDSRGISVAYGGRSGGLSNAGAMYVGTAAGSVYARTATGMALFRTTYAGGAPLKVVMDPDNYVTAYVVDSTTVWRTTNAGLTWTDITGDLVSDYDPGQLRSLAIITGSTQLLALGADRGVFVTQASAPGTWAKFGHLPAVPVLQLTYDSIDNVIIAATHGRGSWKIGSASTVFNVADLRIEKTDRPDPVHAGDEVFYDIKVTNDGPDTAVSVVVTDELPDGFRYLSDDGGCSYNPASHELHCELGDMPSGTSKSFTIKTRSSSDYVVEEDDGTKNAVNVATVTAVSQDPDPSDNRAEATTFVQESADLGVTKLCNPDNGLQAGETAVCTVYVNNFGPSAARDVRLSDVHTSDGSFTIVSATPTQGTCSITGSTVSCDMLDVQAGTPENPHPESVRIEITADEAMTIDDLASVVSNTPDPNSSNNQSSQSLVVRDVSDLALTNTAPPSAIAGTTLSYDLSVVNQGPSRATGVVIEDFLSGDVSVLSVSGSDGATCHLGVPGDSTRPTKCSFGVVAPSTSRTMTVTVLIDPDANWVMTNDARAYGDQFDPEASNNLANVTTTLTADADLGVEFAPTPNAVVAGRSISYEVTVANDGPSLADDAVVRIALPGELRVTNHQVSGMPANCGLQININTVVCQLGDLQPGAEGVVYVTADLDPDTTAPSITTTASVASGTGDSLPANNSAEVTTPVATQADMAIALTSDADRYRPSSIIHYTITVTNNGPSVARDVSISQALPNPKVATYDSNDGGCGEPVNNTFSCNFGDIEVGGTRTVRLNLLIRGNKGTISQTAAVTSMTNDPVTQNNASTRVVTVK